MDQLLANLLDLLREFAVRGVPLMVGGGFGLYLKRMHLARTGERMLFAELPEVRSTNDIDMFIRAEVLANLSRTRETADAIKTLGYKVVEEAKYLQWKKPVTVAGVEQEVKIDVLVGPLGGYRAAMKLTPPRARPKGDIQFHAHMVEEALHIEDEPIGVAVEGRTSDGRPYSGEVYVPEAFPYLLMKLHAFSDRKDDANKDLGRHHALDVYTIVGMMTEREYERARAFGVGEREKEQVVRGREIVATDFSDVNAQGLLRMREHALARPDFRLGEFLSVLREIFG